MAKLSHDDAELQLDLFDASDFKVQAESVQIAKRRSEDERARTSQRSLGDPVAKATQSMEQLLTVQQVAQRFQVSRATIWRWAKGDGLFPKPIKLAAGTSRWRLEDLRDFEKRAASKDLRKTAPGKSGKARTPDGAS